MIALVDTNVVLDVMLNRKPFVSDSAQVLAAVECSRCQGMLCPTTVTTIHYIARRHIGTKASLARLSDLLSIFEVSVVNRTVIETALARNMPDFEDAILHDSAIQGGAGCIVTRNVADFQRAEIPVYSPIQFLAVLD